MSSTAQAADKWFTVGTVDDIPRQGARIVKAGEKLIAIFRTMDNQIFALEDLCAKGRSHDSYCPLSQGIVHGTNVTCPLHNWVISLESGEAQGADEGTTATFPVRLDAQTIQIQLTPKNQPLETPQTKSQLEPVTA